MSDALALVIQPSGTVERIGATDSTDTLLVRSGIGAGGIDVSSAGQLDLGVATATSVQVGSSTGPVTLWAADVATPTVGRDLNDTSVGTAGSFAVGCYDDPTWVNLSPASSDLQAMLDAIDVAVGAGATLQSAYEASPTITETTGDGAITIARGTNTGAAVLIVNDNTSAVGRNVIEIDKSPTSGPTTGNVIQVTVGANMSGRAFYATDAGTGTTLELDKTGSSGSLLTLASSSTPVLQIDRVGRVIMGGYASISIQPLTSITAGIGGYSADFEGGDGFAAGGGSDATAGGVALIQAGTGGASDGTNAAAGGGQTTLRGGTGGAGSGALAGVVGATARIEGGQGGAQGTTGDPGGGGSVIIVGGAAGAGGAGNAANGGPVNITGGRAASNATGTFGGNVVIAGGDEGSGGTGIGGTVTLNGGAGTTRPGDIYIGTTRARKVDSGNATDDPTWTHTGAFAVTTAAQKNPLLNLTQPTQTRATAANFAEVIQMNSTGTNAEAASILLGADDPNDATAVNEGEVGSVFLDAATPELWQKVAASTWERIGVTGTGLISLTGGSTAQTGVTSTPAQVTGFTANGADPELTTPDNTSDDITLDAPGVWKATWTCSFTGTNNTIYTGRITCTGTGTVSGGTWQREIPATAGVGHATAVAYITGAVATDTVECTIECDSGTVSFTPTEMTLLVERIRRS